MPKITYVPRDFSAASLVTIARANEIVEEYAAAGFDLTLRQIYYQFVSRGIIPNKDSEYKKLGSVVNDARLAGLIDWDRIVDRTRELRSNSHWDGPQNIVASCSRQFQIDKWQDQELRVEIWIEKDALVGVIDEVCRELDVAFFSCRGYTSQSEMWSAAQRLRIYERADQETRIFHLGDHDPSGIDMSRDIEERLQLFRSEVTLERLALNMDQVKRYNPPPNPAKVTDSRFASYVDKYGEESWELDALEPQVIVDLVREAVLAVRDEDKWEDAVEQETEARRKLGAIAERWSEFTGEL
jgi:hypothetical protein